MSRVTPDHWPGLPYTPSHGMVLVFHEAKPTTVRHSGKPYKRMALRVTTPEGHDARALVGLTTWGALAQLAMSPGARFFIRREGVGMLSTFTPHLVLDERAAWLRETLGAIIADNAHHGVEGLWADYQGKPVDPDSEDIEWMYAYIEQAARDVAAGRVP